jgi:hypothetical protein
MNMTDPVTFSGYVTAIVTGVGGWFLARGRRNAETAAVVAETGIITMLREEVTRLSLRVSGLEQREGKLIRHVYRLEGLMRANNIDPPPFDIDGEPIRAGGTD